MDPTTESISPAHGQSLDLSTTNYTEEMLRDNLTRDDHTDHPILDPRVPNFHPTGTELQRFTHNIDQSLRPLTSIINPGIDASYQLLNDKLALQHFAMTIKANHQTQDMRAVAQHAERNAREIDNVKELVRGDLRALKAQIDQLQAHFTRSTELEGGVLGDLSVREEWRAKYSTAQIAAAYQTQVEEFTVTAAKLSNERSALLAEVADPGVAVTTTSQECGDDAELAAEASAHSPPRRERESHAIEIKKPESVPVTALDGQTSTVSWIPLAVRQMPASPVGDESANTETFPWEYIRQSFGGAQWSPGFYFVAGDSKLPSKSYWILDRDFEPFLPPAPGQHGAKLTACFNSTGCADIDGVPDAENYLTAPVFLRNVGQHEYTYFGMYSQLRFSDKLDHDRVLDDAIIPEKVRRYWAMQLAEHGRPEWVTQALMAHFWPAPVYSCAPYRVAADARRKSHSNNNNHEDHDNNKRTLRAAADHVRTLRDWEKTARIKASLLTSDALMASFAHADADEEPGLRLWWEYFQCVGYDQEFYNMMVALKNPGKPANSVRGTKGSGRFQERASVRRSCSVKSVGSRSPQRNGDPRHEVDSPPDRMGGVGLMKQMHESFVKAGQQHGSGVNAAHSGSSGVPPHMRRK